MIRVIVADRDRLVAQAMGRVIDQEPDMRVTKICADSSALVRGLQAHNTDVVVIDPLGLTAIGVELVRSLREVHPEVRIVIVTASQQEQHLFAAVRAGVRGYVSKSADMAEVLAAIRAAYEGTAVLSRERAVQLMDEFARHCYDETGLSPRQRDILAGIIQAKSNREIAADLGLAEKTIKNYMHGVFAALGCQDRTQAAIAGIRRGLVRESDAPSAGSLVRTHNSIDDRASRRHVAGIPGRV